MNKKLRSKINDVIAQVEVASHNPNPSAFLLPIKAALWKMQTAVAMTSHERERLAGALFRLVTEDFSFSESPLGTILLEVGDEFATSHD